MPFVTKQNALGETITFYQKGPEDTFGKRHTRKCDKVRKKRYRDRAWHGQGNIHPKFRKKQRRTNLNNDPKPDSPLWYEREPREAQSWAFEAYKSGMPLVKICKKTGYPRHTLYSLIFGKNVKSKGEAMKKQTGWYYRLVRETWDNLAMGRLEKLKNLTDEQLLLVAKAQRSLQEKEDFDVADAPKLVTMAKELHQMEKLEESGENDPTKINIKIDFTAGKVTEAIQDLFSRLKLADEGLIEYEKTSNIITPQFKKIEKIVSD